MDKAEYIFYKLAGGAPPEFRALPKLPTSGINDITSNPDKLGDSLLRNGKFPWKQHFMGHNAYMGHDKPTNDFDNGGGINNNHYSNILKSRGYAPPQSIP